jgi:hypothetical protein
MEALSSQIEKENIDSLCEKYNIENYTINSDGFIDVNGDVNLFSRGLTDLPLKFNKVTGNFDCGSNKLTSLAGCPKDVGGNFDCQDNELTSLEHSPSIIAGNFNYSNNKLSHLEYCTYNIGGSHNYSSNDLPQRFIEAFSLLNDEEKRIFLRYQSIEEIWTDIFNMENCDDFIHGKDGIKDGLL